MKYPPSFPVIYGLPRLRQRELSLRGDGLLSYIRLRDGTSWVPSPNGFRVTAAPMHSHGLTSQPMTDLRVCCGPGIRVRPSVRVACYAILGKFLLGTMPRDTFA